MPRYDTFTLILIVILFLAVVITAIETWIRKADKPDQGMHFTVTKPVDVQRCRLCKAPTDGITTDTLCVPCRDDLEAQSMESKR